jgi:flagellar basal-body rod protein FlgF
MTISSDVMVSAQLALQRRLDTIAGNIANANTAGFRAEHVEFTSILSRMTDKPVHFASQGGVRLSTETGAFSQTGNPLDVAINGPAWLAVQTPSGQAFTRDGRLKVSPAGELLTATGYRVLDAGGAPVALNPNAGPPEITREGQVRQAGRLIGGIGLYTLPADAPLARYGDTLVTSTQPATPVVDPAVASLHQGFVENSNVNSVEEVTSLITVTRTFDAVTAMMRTMDNARRDAIRDIGSG